MSAVRTLVFVVSWSVSLSSVLVAAPGIAQEGIPKNIRPPWVKPDSAELALRRAARRPARIPSETDGITLTAAQEAQMATARNRYRPQIRAMIARLEANPSSLASAETTRLQDSIQQLLTAQRTDVLAVLTSQQRAQYESNQQQIAQARATATPQSRVAPSRRRSPPPTR
jgi:hypothetical protein